MLRLLGTDPGLLESGLTALDSEVPLGPGATADLLTCDRIGDPVLVLLVDGDPSLAVGRVAATLAGWERQREILEHFYGRKGLSSARRPRFVLLARRFPDATPALLDVLAGVDVRAVEYRLARTSDGRAVLDLFPFHRTAALRAGVGVGAGLGAASPAPSAPSPASPGAPDDETQDDGAHYLAGVESAPVPRELFLKAFRSVRDLAERVRAEGGEGRVTFHVGDAVLASLVLANKGLHVLVGDGSDEPRIVTDDASLHGALNAVFGHYFAGMAGG